MFNHSDLKWVAAHLAELNRHLQKIGRYTDQAQQKSGSRFLPLLADEVEQASKTSQALTDRVTARTRGEMMNGKNSGRPPKLRLLPAPTTQDPSPKVTSVSEPGKNSAFRDGLTIRNPQGRRELILVVDDDEEVLDRASAMLEDQDYRVALAKDGLEALHIYAKMSAEISLIILDFFLPVMDGDAVFEELQALNPNVQVVLSSGFAEQTKLGAMLARGLCGFIPKPYTSEKLLDQVRSIVAA
jgi:CheY-like chemotaxis protein